MILGLYGNHGSGKSTISKRIENEYGFTYYELSSPLKKISEFVGFNLVDKNNANEMFGVSTRTFLEKLSFFLNQTLGMDYCLYCFKEFLKLHSCENIVVDGIYLYTQAEYIASIGKIIQISRKESVPSSFDFSNFPCDYILQEDQDICELLESLLEKK
jgi:hypothetical protein